ncbi:MAG TPA: hypothetical protein VK899_06445 [Gemmatimonadales bacterium]|nr:hypothetical protein [Gemmatimonadales bacterium]
MCVSVHELTTREVEKRIADIRRVLDGPLTEQVRGMWEWRLAGMEALLKERAENGTIWR